MAWDRVALAYGKHSTMEYIINMVSCFVDGTLYRRILKAMTSDIHRPAYVSKFLKDLAFHSFLKVYLKTHLILHIPVLVTERNNSESDASSVPSSVSAVEVLCFDFCDVFSGCCRECTHLSVLFTSLRNDLRSLCSVFLSLVCFYKDLLIKWVGLYVLYCYRL